MTERALRTESAGTVIIAGLANLTVAAAKAVAGVVSGSAAVLSEAAHSFADTTTEMLLFVAVRRGTRPPDDEHPFGHGRESYIWALIAAVLTFIAGAGFSIFQGVRNIQTERQTQDALASYIVLAVSFVAESVSLTRASRQVQRRAQRRRITPLRVVRRTPNTTVKAVVLEDTAALIGLVLAAAGLGLSQLTGAPFWDGAASIAIGVLLLVVATTLARTNLSLLTGRSAGDIVREEIYQELALVPSVRRIDSLLTLQLGPDDILVAAKVVFACGTSSADVARAAEEAQRRLLARDPAIRFVFLHPAGVGPAPPPGETAWGPGD